MAKLQFLFVFLSLFLMFAKCSPVVEQELDETDLSTADTISYGYYPGAVRPWPSYYGRSYGYGGYGGIYGYGGYRGYRSYYRRPIYPVWG